MAIVQISKIQQRAGNLVDLPQLDNAEFGWAADENRLFIGRTGNTYTDQNIEVLTSYSNISFSQINGSDGGNFNITTPLNGQILTYVSSTDTWENYTGSNTQLGGTKLQLGNVANISMTGGAIGYVLQTDGSGNLSWTPKGTLYTPITNFYPTVFTGSIGTSTLSGVVIAGTGGQFTCTASSTTLYVGMAVTISGTKGGGGSITGYTNPTTYLISVTNGSTSFTLTTSLGAAIVTTSGTPTGLTYTLSNLLNISAVTSGSVGVGTYITGTSVTAGTYISAFGNGTGGTGTYIVNSSQTIASTTLYGPLIMGVANTTPYTNGQTITITGVNGVANANVNGLTFYLSLTANYASSGNVSLYTDNARTIGANGTSLTYTNSPNAIATASVGGSGGATVGGANTTVQFNDQNVLTGNASFTYNKLTNTLTISTGNIVTGNVNATTTVTASRLVSNVAVGTAPLTVTSTTQVANLNVATAGAVQTNASACTTVYLTGTTSSANGYSALNVDTNITANLANHAISAWTVVGNLVGSVTTAAQGNITSLGTLTSLAVTGNTTSGNFIGSLANGNSNVNIPAIYGNVTVSVTGTSNVVVITNTGMNVAGTANISGNVSSANLISSNTTGAAFNINGATQTTLNAAGGNINVTSGTGNGTGKGGGLYAYAGNAAAAGNAAGGEVQLAGGAGYGQGQGGNAGIYGGNSANATGAFGGNIVLTGGTYTGVGGNLVAKAGAAFGTDKAGGITIISGGAGTGAGTPGNVAIQVSTALTTGTTTQTLSNIVVVTSTGANITGTANISGNANVNNLGTARVLASGNITTPQFISNVAIGTAPFVVTSTTQVANLNVATAGSATSSTNAAAVQTNTSTSSTVYLAGVTSSSNGNSALNIVTGITANFAANTITATTFNGNLSGSVTTAAQGNITSLGSLTGLTVSNATGVVNLVTTANVSLGAVANVHITGGNGNQILQTDGSGNLSWTDPNGGYYLHTQVSTSTTWTVTHNLNRQYLTVEPIDSSGNSYTGRYDYPTINYTNANSFTMTFLSAVAGYAAVTGGGTNINSVSVGNSTPGGVNTQVQFNDDGNLAGSSGLVYDKTTGTLTATLLTSTLTTAAQPNITSVGTLTSLGVNGTITATRLISNVATGTAPFTVTSTTQVANLNSATAGTVRTAAQPNITSVGTLTSLSVTGTTTSGNFATAGNITASFLVSNVATGTAPFTVTSTTQVANLNVATAGEVQTNASACTTVYLTGTTSSANGYSALNVDNNITANLANHAISAWTVVGNLVGSVITATQGNITSVGALTSLAVTGNANINTGTPVAYSTSGSIITGRILGRYANRSGNANYYFADYNASNVITSADATSVLKLGSLLDTSIGNSNISMAVGTNYGNKTAGVAFVSGTSNDVLNVVANTAPLYTGNINAVMLGYPTVGPRILIQDYALSDDSPNVITYIGTTHSFIGNITASDLTLANNSTISMGSNTNIGTFTGNFSLSAGSRLNATYADLAEYYEADNEYEPGTVLEFGGDKEVTLAQAMTPRVAGVVSTNPAYVMNSTCKGEHIVAIALQGRVPCKVRGTIRKGDLLISDVGGFAKPSSIPLMGTVIGKSLENFEGEGVIEVAVGRL